MDQIDCAVIGAGVVGLAVARELALAGREVLVLEAAEGIGTEVSSRNSEVIHAGIYYPNGSLKAKLCVAGKHLLYEYCKQHGVAHRRLGKVIVATSEAEITTLEKYQKLAAGNEVMDLEWLDQADVYRLEPAVRAVAGLWSPSTGIVDSHALMLALQGDAERNGAVLAFHAPVVGGEIRADGIVLKVGGSEPTQILCRSVVNSAGLGAQRVAASILGVPPHTVARQYLAKGYYFGLTGRSPFQHLVYPVPVPGGLGTHVTLDLGGQARFGPDVHWIDAVDYEFDESQAPGFYDSVRRYYPALKDGQLVPGYVGVRPKISGPNDPASDFLIQTEAEHTVHGLVNLYGIESPGLTASLAIAARVCAALR